MKTSLLAACLVALITGATQGQSVPIDPAMKAMRQQALDKPRRILWNHDGGGSVGVTKENLKAFLETKRNPARLIGTQVDTIMFCSSSQFGTSNHFTKVGHIVDSNYAPENPTRMDTTRLGDYLDPLTVMVEFGHAHHMEVFWSMRMNDTHDGSGHDFAPAMLAANTFKQAHPEWLLGSKENQPIHGVATGVNYEIPEVRDFAFRTIEEVCQDYDVDGIELDFFRHPTFFKYAAAGVPTTQAQRDMMTDLMRRVRIMADAVGKKRGRALLIAVKVPDSQDYDKAIGLDVERWLADGFVDMLIPGGYIRMEDWSTSVALGHRYGVKVYPSLDDVRFDPPKEGKALDPTQALRVMDAGYRGRAIEAWSAQADGIYLFNFFGGSIFKPPFNVLKELGSPTDLVHKDRNYFGSYMGLGKISGGGFSHKFFQKIETLCPTSPKPVAAGAPASASVNIPEQIPAVAKVDIKLRFSQAPDAGQLAVRINDQELASPAAEGNWLTYPCDPALLKKGVNQVGLTLSAGRMQWQDLAVEVHAD